MPGRCATYAAFLYCWQNYLASATATLICSRCAEVPELPVQVCQCDLWRWYEEQAGYTRFRGGAAVNVKISTNDQFRQGHQPCLCVPRNPDFDVIDKLLGFQREAGLSLPPLLHQAPQSGALPVLAALPRFVLPCSRVG